MIGSGRTKAFVDPLGKKHARIRLPDSTTVYATQTQRLSDTVKSTKRCNIDHFTVDQVSAWRVVDADGEVIQTHIDDWSAHREEATYTIEFATPLPLLACFTSDFKLHTDHDQVSIRFPEKRMVDFGVRPNICLPSHTVQVADTAESLFRGVSTFGSVMTTQSPERSLPWKRPHPPRIHVDDRFKAAETLTGHHSPVTVRFPLSKHSAAIAAPLVYYLGGALEEGKKPHLELSNGQFHYLDPDALAADTSRILYKVLFLDSLAREARGRDQKLKLRDRFAAAYGFDWEEIRTLDPMERLTRYFEIETRGLEDHLPDWEQRAYATPSKRLVESIPYLAYDLRVPFPYADSERHPRCTRSNSQRLPTGLTRHHAPDVIGRNAPVGVHRAYPASFVHRQQRRIDPDGPVIRIACTDPLMEGEAEDSVSIYSAEYGDSIRLEFSDNVGTEQLESLLTAHSDFFHYIGHVKPRGFECTDGFLDASSIQSVGAEVAFLNACQSNRQLVKLIENGAVAGIGTRIAVPNTPAMRFGLLLARLLIRGFPLEVALRIARRARRIGKDYVRMGDPKVELPSPTNPFPFFCEIRTTKGNQFELTINTCLTTSYRPGSATPFEIGDETVSLLNSESHTLVVEPEAIRDFLQRYQVPLFVDDDFVWSDEWLEAGTPPAL